MDIQQLAQGKYIHWGAYCSLYTGKTRAYLIKKGIEHIELNSSHLYFAEQVLPRVGFFSLPVLQTPDGEIIQDSTEIISFLEQRYPQPSLLPVNKPMQAVAWLLHNYGTDGLLPAAMHYRWSYKEANYDYIVDEFARGLLPHEARRNSDARAEAVAFADKMDAYLQALGITPATIPVVEDAVECLFERLNEHFTDYPYLLGGRPSVADCGMMAGLFAHLARDPHASQLMKARAPGLYRWTETMNRPGVVDPELWHVAPEFFSLETLPDTLLVVLQQVCADFGAELEATAAAYHHWLECEGQLTAGTLVAIDGEAGIRQRLGEVSFALGGGEIRRQVWADTLLTHQRVLDLEASMSETERGAYAQLLRRAQGHRLLSIRVLRPLTRVDNRVVLR